MTKEEIIEKLKVFDDFKFFEDGHYYEYKGKRVGISVTRLIEEYANEFDSQGMAEKVANRDGKSVSEVLEEWKVKNEQACLKGDLAHSKAQNKFKGINILTDDKNLLENTKMALEKILGQIDNFYNDYKDRLEHIYDELPIGSGEYDIASCVDHLFYNKLTGGLVLVDYKSNSYITGYNKEPYKKKMLLPLNHLNDDAITHYHLQVSIYKYLIEKYTGLKVEDIFIVYFSENIENYEIIEGKYLKNEVERIFNLRRIKIMSQIILVMGEPASGKTVSLRNIPKEEMYYIDCDKKGLNYKGWRNDFNEEKKNYCRTTDSNMIAKILKGLSDSREDIKYIAVDTINSVMIADEMRRSKDKNYDKWTDLAMSVYNIVEEIAPDLRDDMVVIFIGHTQTDDNDFTRLLTNGKKLNKIGLEKYFDTVLIAKNMDGRYVFETTSPNSTARVPMGFECEQYIDSDLYEVIKQLKEF